MSGEILGFYFLFWWLIQIFYKITSLDQEDCKIKTFIRLMNLDFVYTKKYKIFVVLYLCFCALLLIYDLNQGSVFSLLFFLPTATVLVLVTSDNFYNFLSDLVDCQLCMESHLGFIISLPIAFYYEDYRVLLLGYSAAGFNNIIKRITNE